MADRGEAANNAIVEARNLRDGLVKVFKAIGVTGIQLPEV